MQRRDFIKGVAAAGTVAAIGRRAHAVVKGWREFEITYRINVKDSATAVQLWVPVPQDALDYQRVIDLSWRSPVATHVLWEATSRAPIVSAAWIEPSIAREVEIIAQVATRDRSGFYPDASHEELVEYLKPTASSPNDGVVLAKAREIVGALDAGPEPHVRQRPGRIARHIDAERKRGRLGQKTRDRIRGHERTRLSALGAA